VHQEAVKGEKKQLQTLRVKSYSLQDERKQRKAKVT
jgi:hypothetical protein